MELTEMDCVVIVDALDTHKAKRLARKIPAAHASAVAMEILTIDLARAKVAAERERLEVARVEGFEYTQEATP